MRLAGLLVVIDQGDASASGHRFIQVALRMHRPYRLVPRMTSS
jgi:hypothetical protein